MKTFNDMSIEYLANKYRATAFLKRLIQIKSINPPGDVFDVIQCIKEKLIDFNIESEVYDYGNGKANLIASIKGKEPGKKLVLSGHADTVDVGESNWGFHPFSGFENDGKIYGRGSSDMKGGIVSLLFSFIFLKIFKKIKKGELVLAISFGEETGSEGAKKIIQNNILNDADGLIIGEPTKNELYISHKGVLWVEIECFGRTGHSSSPSQGVNAIDCALNFINELRKAKDIFDYEDGLLGKPTMTLTKINAGKNVNMIPDYCKAFIDIRTISIQDNEQILLRINEIAKYFSKNSFQNVKINCVNNLPPLKTSDNSPLSTISQKVLKKLDMDSTFKGINYFTDGSVFTKQDIKDAIVLGPGDPKMAHQPDEFVKTNKLIEAMKVYTEIIVEYYEF